MTFEYFYDNEAEQFSFYRIPKLLFKDKIFKSISTDAKVLYGLMLDRMGLSLKNRWLDDENRVYIIYTLQDIMDDFDCADQKATKLLKELDTKNGIGLIERKRQGLCLTISLTVLWRTASAASTQEYMLMKRTCSLKIRTAPTSC